MELSDYMKHYEEFCKIDDFNLEHRTKQVPAEKHFWVARLVETKIQKEKLKRQHRKLRKEVVDKLTQTSPVILSKKTLDDLDTHPSLSQIVEQMDDLDLVIGYLENVVKCVSFIGNDIKNIIEIKNLEQN